MSKVQCQEAASVHLLMSYSYITHSRSSKSKNMFFFFTLVKETAHLQPTLHQIKISSPTEGTAHHSPPSLTPSWRVLWFPEYGP